PLRDLIDARAVAIRPVLSEPGDARVYEPRVDLAERRIIDPEAGLHVGPEVLDDDVRLGSQPPEDVESGARLQIQRDAPLVAVHVLEVGTVAWTAKRIGGLEVLGNFNLDDVRAPIRQLADARRSGAHAAQVEDCEARERKRRLRDGHAEQLASIVTTGQHRRREGTDSARRTRRSCE